LPAFSSFLASHFCLFLAMPLLSYNSVLKRFYRDRIAIMFHSLMTLYMSRGGY
jgi:hypothetical protein